MICRRKIKVNKQNEDEFESASQRNERVHEDCKKAISDLNKISEEHIQLSLERRLEIERLRAMLLENSICVNCGKKILAVHTCQGKK